MGEEFSELRIEDWADRTTQRSYQNKKRENCGFQLRSNV